MNAKFVQTEIVSVKYDKQTWQPNVVGNLARLYPITGLTLGYCSPKYWFTLSQFFKTFKSPNKLLRGTKQQHQQ